MSESQSTRSSQRLQTARASRSRCCFWTVSQQHLDFQWMFRACAFFPEIKIWLHAARRGNLIVLFGWWFQMFSLLNSNELSCFKTHTHINALPCKSGPKPELNDKRFLTKNFTTDLINGKKSRGQCIKWKKKKKKEEYRLVYFHLKGENKSKIQTGKQTKKHSMKTSKAKASVEEPSLVNTTPTASAEAETTRLPLGQTGSTWGACKMSDLIWRPMPFLKISAFVLSSLGWPQRCPNTPRCKELRNSQNKLQSKI